MKFATKLIQHYPSHLGKFKIQFFANIQEIWKNANKLYFIASNVVVHPQILIF